MFSQLGFRNIPMVLHDQLFFKPDLHWVKKMAGTQYCMATFLDLIVAGDEEGYVCGEG